LTFTIKGNLIMVENREKVIELRGLEKRYGEQSLFSKFDLTVY